MLYKATRRQGRRRRPHEAVLNKLGTSKSLLGTLCNINIGMRTGADKVSDNYIETYKLDLTKGEGIYVLTDYERRQMRLNKLETSMLLPFFKNSDIQKYNCKTSNDLWLIDLTYPNRKRVNSKSIPNIYNHIKRFEKILKGRRSNDNGLQAVIKAGYWWLHNEAIGFFPTEDNLSSEELREYICL